ncbi:site-specific DNA-methyltransferase, partial [Campylobacter coli]|nr:site-specific DNA-methyltransferase [Campylobacter coli]
IKLIEKLAEMIVPKQTNNIIIDPFMGSGTTALACKNLGIPYIGFELNEEYIKIANMRLS